MRPDPWRLGFTLPLHSCLDISARAQASGQVLLTVALTEWPVIFYSGEVLV
jgi:hypothetical protein